MLSFDLHLTNHCNELAALDILRALEFTALTSDCEFMLYSNSFNFTNLISEFNFKHITHYRTTPLQNSICLSKSLLQARSRSSLIKNFRDQFSRTTAKLPSQKTKPFPKNTITFKRHARLGDCISIVIGLEGYLKYRGIPKIRITGPHLLEQIISIFQCTQLEFVEHDENTTNLDFLFSLAPWDISWPQKFFSVLSDFYGEVSPICPLPDGLKMLKAKRAPGQQIYCQFDTRSSDVNLIKYAPTAISLIAGNKTNVVILGGPDTKKYLGSSYLYQFAELEEIIDILLTAKLFIGCDSGIGHLAGCLDIPSYIFNFTDFVPVYHFFSSYKNTHVIDRAIIELIHGNQKIQ